ncbi:unnamed protein product [Chrysoparadoxa australica]
MKSQASLTFLSCGLALSHSLRCCSVMVQSQGGKLPQTSPQPAWREQLEGIKKMRAKKQAQVDINGAKAIKERSSGTPQEIRFQVLLSAMLSAQTRDEVTAAALVGLQELTRSYGKLSPVTLLEPSEEEVATAIKRVSFYNRKAKHMREVCRILLSTGEEDWDIPNTTEGLMSLPGVGPKMTYLVMDLAWGKCEGICVDTHVHRIAGKLGWVSQQSHNQQEFALFTGPAPTPEHTRKALEAWLPRELWPAINPLLVGHGQGACKAIGPRCGDCTISSICPSSELPLKTS